MTEATPRLRRTTHPHDLLQALGIRCGGPAGNPHAKPIERACRHFRVKGRPA